MVTLTSEFEVLKATIVWLHTNGWTIESVSIATGKGLPPIEQQKAQLERDLETADIPFYGTIYRSKGPDIIAHSHEGTWKMECKGLGSGTSQTLRENFYRAVSSVVSYFDSPETRLGLALANDYLWEFDLGKRLPRALREAINLWVLLLENESIYPYEPTDELPYPGADK